MLIVQMGFWPTVSTHAVFISRVLHIKGNGDVWSTLSQTGKKRSRGLENNYVVTSWATLLDDESLMIHPNTISSHLRAATDLCLGIPPANNGNANFLQWTVIKRS